MRKYQTKEGHSPLKECTCSLQKSPGQTIQRKAQGVFRIKGNSRDMADKRIQDPRMDPGQGEKKEVYSIFYKDIIGTIDR